MEKKVVIIGAGISGLSVGWKLSNNEWDVKILEKTSKIGGMAASFKKDDMILDYGPHKLYSQLPKIMPTFKEILKEECLVVNKKNSIKLQANRTTYKENSP